MNNKKKYIALIAVSLTVILLSIIIFICFDKYKTVDIKQLSNDELIHYAGKEMNSEDFALKKDTYYEIFINRIIEDSEFSASKTDVNNNKIAFMSDFLTIILATKDYGMFENVFPNLYERLSNDDYLFMIQRMFALINYYSSFDNDNYENTYDYLYSYFNDFVGGDNLKDLSSTCLLFFYSASLNKNSDYYDFKERIMYYVNETESEYETIFEKNRFQYVNALLRLKKYDRFNNCFVEVYSENEKFNSLEILNMLNSSNLDAEQLAVLKDALTQLLNSTSSDVNERYLNIESVIKTVQTYIDLI